MLVIENLFSYMCAMLLLLSSDTAYKAQGCSIVLHMVESTDRTMMSETLKILWLRPLL